MKHRTDNYYHNRAQLREELYEWLEEYYMACNAPYQPRYKGTWLSREQWYLFQCIQWVMKIGMQHEDINHKHMYGYLTKACRALLKSLRW